MPVEFTKGSNNVAVQRSWSPADMAFNGATVPNGSPSAYTTAVGMAGTYSFNLFGTSTVACSLIAQVMDVDGTTVLATVTLASAIAANTPFIYHGALELAPSITGSGTVGTSLYLPVPYLRFALQGSAAAGTGTLRLIQSVY